MKLEDLGYNEEFKQFRIDNMLDGFEVGRVTAEHKERYTVKTLNGEFEAEITGNMRFASKTREDFPAVGDWVVLMVYEPDFAIIHKIFPRYSIIKRQAIGHAVEAQVIAANVDYAFLIQAADRDFNMNRLERYITICNAGKVKPVIVLSKIDLLEENLLEEILSNISTRVNNIQVIPLSNTSNKGIDQIKAAIQKSKTYCMLGSSGVGKSSLLNNLMGKDVMKTGAISDSTNKGRHVTSHRELVVLENGGIIIDNPGMREVGITDLSGGLEVTFDSIYALSKSCKFKDCTHTSEAGCSVLEALDTGNIDRALYENYLKLEKEKEHYESTLLEKRKKDKVFGKMMKNYKKDVSKNKFLS